MFLQSVYTSDSCSILRLESNPGICTLLGDKNALKTSTKSLSQKLVLRSQFSQCSTFSLFRSESAQLETFVGNLWLNPISWLVLVSANDLPIRSICRECLLSWIGA